MSEVTVGLECTREIETLTHCAETVLHYAKQQGASSAEVALSLEAGYDVQVRAQDVETIEYNREKGVGVTVYIGQQKGSASSTDTSESALRACVAAAIAIAKVTGQDDCAGLADKSQLATEVPDLALYHPWAQTVAEAIEKGIACERLGLDADKRITRTEGVNISNAEAVQVYANSHGFIGAYPSSRHSMTCTLIAGQGEQMERDYYYTTARQAAQLASIDTVAAHAARRTLRRLNGRQIKTCTAPVIFEADIAKGLIASFINAIRGSALYRRSSFLVDSLGQQIFSPQVQIYELPHLPMGLGSAPFDSEGVATTEQHFIRDGVLENYVLSSYSARKLGMTTTGNAGGTHNVTLATSDKDLTALLKEMGTGLLVTEVMGQGVNIVTGDYSRGASGFWVEGGEIQYPVNEITIAGNLKEMFKQLVYVGNDVDTRGSLRTGSILLEKMTVAGC